MAERERSDLVGEAFPILAGFFPEMAGSLWLHVVVGMSEEEIARLRGVRPKTVQRDINGHTRLRKRVPGAKEYIETIVTILIQAERAGLCDEALRLFNDQRGKSRWGKKFLPTTLGLLTAALDASCLERILRLLALARQDPAERYYDVLGCLLDLYKRKELKDFFPALLRLPAEDEFPTNCVRLLRSLR